MDPNPANADAAPAAPLPPKPGIGKRRAVFLDRDGTLIEHVHELVDPAAVRLVPGTGDGLARLRDAGFLCIVVTNLPLLGRGRLDEAGLDRIHARLAELLAAEAPSARIDAFYACPVESGGAGPDVIEHPDRKPGPGLLLRAAREHGIDLAQSWMVGDSPRDVLAGRHADCRGTILLRSGVSGRNPAAPAGCDHVEDDVAAAAARILAETHAT